MQQPSGECYAAVQLSGYKTPFMVSRSKAYGFKHPSFEAALAAVTRRAKAARGQTARGLFWSVETPGALKDSDWSAIYTVAL